MMTKEGPTKIVNFMTHGAGILMLERDLISHYGEYALSSDLSVYSRLVAIALLLFHFWIAGSVVSSISSLIKL